MTAYRALAGVYEWIVPEGLLEPEGAADAFAPVAGTLPPGVRVLDCAAGTGELAVGLALRGLDVTATDASPEMLERARELADRRDVALRTRVVAWEDLPAQGWDGAYEAVFCVGNSLAHAPGAEARAVALRAIASVLAPGGVLVVTSRTWELVRAGGTRLEVEDRLVRRRGRDAVVARAWTIAEGWDEPHGLDIAVALLSDDAAVSVHRERLEFWPFRHETLEQELRAAGLTPERSTVGEGADRYLISARR